MSAQAQRMRQAVKEFDKQLRDKISQKNYQNVNDQVFLSKQFKYFDVMNKGRVDFDQFTRAVEKIGVVQNEFDLGLVFKQYDVSGDGYLDFKEFGLIFS